MNIYIVESEHLEATYSDGWNIPVGATIPESYCIYELVAAESRGQAGYMAWQNDPGTCDDLITEKPKMSIKVVAKGVDASKGIVTQDPEYQHLWGGDEDEQEEAT